MGELLRVHTIEDWIDKDSSLLDIGLKWFGLLD